MRQVLVFLTLAMMVTGCGVGEIGEACATGIYEESDCVETAICVPDIARVADQSGLANYWWMTPGATTETNEDGTTTVIAPPEVEDPNMNEWGSERSFTCRQRCMSQSECTVAGEVCTQIFGTTVFACQPLDPTPPVSTDSDS